MSRAFGIIMIAAALIALVMCLSGCATAYEPYAVEIAKPDQYASDLKACQAYAAAYKPKFDAPGLAESAGEGAAGNAVGAAVNPLVPVIGAVGAVAQTLLSDLGLSQADRKKIVARCMKEKLRKDGAGLPVDPND